MLTAAFNRVTTALFRVKDLLHMQDVGLSTYKLGPVFSSDAVPYYYPIL